jgi:hypothetical protein
MAGSAAALATFMTLVEDDDIGRRVIMGVVIFNFRFSKLETFTAYSSPVDHFWGRSLFRALLKIYVCFRSALFKLLLKWLNGVVFNCVDLLMMEFYVCT